MYIISMSRIFLVFPHQLFKDLEPIQKATVDHIILVEHPVFFGWRDTTKPMNFNKLKLVLHKASMAYYREYIAKQFRQVHHITIEDYQKSQIMPLNTLLKRLNSKEVIYYDLVDYYLEDRLSELWRSLHITPTILETPNFINSTADNEEFKRFKGKKAWYHATFYGWQRRHHKILLTDNGKYQGGKLSFDTENRKPLPKSIQIPDLPVFRSNKYLVSAIKAVETSFPNNIGNTKNTGHLLYTHDMAESALRDFIRHRLEHFGDYEDAMHTEHRFIFHSVLSSAINIGLLNPLDVVKEVERAYHEHQSIGIHNVEGFIRQVLGWREFTRLLYRSEYKTMKTLNSFRFKGRLTSAWYTGTTGLRPVDDTIKQAIDWGYLHHIQRLMIMGNIMSLVRMDPDEVYKWFMEFAIDSYDWVMISNVYGMASHSDEGMTTTKPYVSSSNYVLNMSNWRADGKWDKTWRQLYYNFVGTLQLPNGDYYFSKNRRTGLAWRNWMRLSRQEQDDIKREATKLIGELTS